MVQCVLYFQASEEASRFPTLFKNPPVGAGPNMLTEKLLIFRHTDKWSFKG